jgi:hypothetical protein
MQQQHCHNPTAGLDSRVQYTPAAATAAVSALHTTLLLLNKLTSN